MLISEAGRKWRPLAGWAEFLVQFGYQWPSGDLGSRRISLVSMPCDSAAAGLIALGALVRDLGSPTANDVDGHYDALLRYARQYLESCRICNDRCHPEATRCGYTFEATGRVRHLGHLYSISERTDLDQRSLAFSQPKISLVWWPSPENADEWQVDGVPPPQALDQSGALNPETYLNLVRGAQVIADNLRSSFSGLSLAGRTSGGSRTRDAYASLQFQFSRGALDLSELLTIHGWSTATAVSRLAFFNARTELPDRACNPSLVIADGDQSFLKVLGRKEFQGSDVIGVVHRAVDRSRLEAVGDRMIGLRQWYVEDPGVIDRLPRLPRGMNSITLKRESR